MQYGCSVFLINQEQCSGSVYLPEYEHIASRLKYLSGVVELEGEKLLLFNLDGFLRTRFSIPLVEDEKRRLALISDITVFKPRIQKFLGKILSQAHGDVSKTRIAFLVRTKITMETIDVRDLSSFPAGISKYLKQRGLIAMRFTEPPGYFIDLETLLVNALFFDKSESH